MSFRRPPQPGTIGLAGDPPLTLTAAPTIITPGAGIIARTIGQGFLIDGPLNEPVESVNLFSAGAVSAAGTVGVWSDFARSRSVYVRKLIANLRTAQTVADAANYYRLKITDAAGALTVLPFTALSRTFSLDQGIGATIETGSTNPGAPINSAHQGWGSAHRFTCAQTIALCGLTLTGAFVQWTFAGGITSGCIVRASILDNVGNVLAKAYQPISQTSGNNLLRFAFTQSAVVKPNTPYWLAFDVFENGPAVDPANTSNLFHLNIQSVTNNPNGAFTGALGLLSFDGLQQGVYFANVGAGGNTCPTPAQVATLNWPDILAVRQVFVNNQFTYVTASNQGASPNMAYQVMGSPSGLAILSGDLTFAVDAVGAPVAGAAGSDLSIMAVLAVS